MIYKPKEQRLDDSPIDWKSEAIRLAKALEEAYKTLEANCLEESDVALRALEK